MSKLVSGITTIGVTLISAALFIFMSIILFFLNVWIIKVGAGWAGYTNLSGDWVVVSATLLSAAAVISSAVRR